jgi:coenzyme F420-0:L-glutamate ligase/coenzyme F420-1:gamma-L-glutamate ligase
MAGAEILVRAFDTVPHVKVGDDIACLVLDALDRSGDRLKLNDIVVLAQKIVSKAEGRTVSLATVVPSAEALRLAHVSHKDPRILELILSESLEVLRCQPGLVVVVHRLGLVLANAGIDQSNIEAGHALLLPLDPDASCRSVRDALIRNCGQDVGVMIIDSIGRAWRNGTVGTVLGSSGVPTLLDLRGQPDIHGRRLQSTELGIGDELAAAASITMGQAGEGRPIALIRGFPYAFSDGSARDLIRSKEKDVFR